MRKIEFSTALLFAPVAYAVHHFEEHIVFNFREWRLLYFPDSNSLSTELVFMILTSITLVYVILHMLFANRASAQSAILFLMATQVHNVIFHAAGSLVFWDFSPGLVTALLLYVPVNVLISRRALEEKWVTWRSLLLLFLAGGVVFWSFEVFGPVIILLMVIATYVWITVETLKSGVTTVNS